MPRFFVSASDIETTSEGVFISVHGDDAAHISRVLRMRPGETLTACDPDGKEYETVVRQTGADVLLEVLSARLSENEPPYRAVVYQALVKGDRFDTVLQKATELGACAFVPVITSRCTVKLTPQEYGKKVERWQRIALEAAKQSGRAMIPTVSSPVSLEEAVRQAAGADLPLFCYEGGGTNPLPAVCAGREKPSSVSVLIGPEGGYAPEEAALAEQAGMCMTGLGRRILRTETAAPFVLSCLSYQFEL